MASKPVLVCVHANVVTYTENRSFEVQWGVSVAVSASVLPALQESIVEPPGWQDELVSQPYVDMTVKLMARYGVVVERLNGLNHMKVGACL